MTAMPVTIRPATTSDAATLASFAERTFRATYADFNTPENMDAYVAGAFSTAIQGEELANPAVTCLLAEADGTLAGYAQLTTRLTGTATELEIDRFYVDVPWHGRGIANQLMEQVVSSAHNARARRIVLGVWQENQRAVKFYAKSGFTVSGPATFLLGDDLQHDWIMTRLLEQP
jgi:diamine N-acetyltransferase